MEQHTSRNKGYHAWNTLNNENGSQKCQFKSPRKGDNDNDCYKTTAMIRQQLYGSGGPYVISQQTAGKPSLTVRGHRGDTFHLKLVHGGRKAKFTKVSLKSQFKSPREDDNDYNHHETIEMIRQQLYGPGGPYEKKVVNQADNKTPVSNSVVGKRKRCCDDHDVVEIGDFSRQPAKKPKPGSTHFNNLTVPRQRGQIIKREPVSGGRKFRVKKVSKKCQFKSPREDDSDSNHHETIEMIRQQLYGSGGPYEKKVVNQADNKTPVSNSMVGKRKRCHSDHEVLEMGDFIRPSAKKTKLGHEIIALIRQQLYGPGGPYKKKAENQTNNKTPVSNSVVHKHKRHHSDHEVLEMGDFSRPPAKKTKLGHETTALIRQQLYGPGGPYKKKVVNQTNNKTPVSNSVVRKHKRCHGNHKVTEMGDFSRPPAQKLKRDSADFDNRTVPRQRGDIINREPVYGGRKFRVKEVSLKCKFKSPREDDSDSNHHETIEMIRQQLYGPGGPYEKKVVNQANNKTPVSNSVVGKRKRCRDDHEDEEDTAFSQQPPKNIIKF